MLQNELYGVFGLGAGLFLFILILIWSYIWKAWALWISARKGEPIWFIALLIINTFGILELIYIFFISKDTRAESYKEKIFKSKKTSKDDKDKDQDLEDEIELLENSEDANKEDFSDNSEDSGSDINDTESTDTTEDIKREN